MKQAFLDKKYLFAFLFAYLILGLWITFRFEGTGDSGDSIMHYLFARSAPAHPELYFHHWAKPLYVLLASPFAQFGFEGLKFFNLLNILFCFYFIHESALLMGMRRTLVAPFIGLCSPLVFVLTYSGLTEPLFALFNILGFWLILRKKEIPALIIISFLPFIRSEGLLICGAYVLYLLWYRRFSILPWLLTGSVIYSIAGSLVHGNLLWIFTEIPYATLQSVYGKGSLFHFVGELYFVVGFPVYCLFFIGLIFPLFTGFRAVVEAKSSMLIWLCFFSVFIAHSLFWYFGIFGSMGLKRVLICVLPQICLIGLNGFNALLDLVPRRIRFVLSTSMIAYVLLFPFLPNPAALQLPADLEPDAEQKLALPVLKVIREDQKIYPLVYNHHYLSMALDIDHFDLQKHRELNTELIASLPTGALIIWETVYAQPRSGLSEEQLDKDKRLEKIFHNVGMAYGSEMRWAVYRKR